MKLHSTFFIQALDFGESVSTSTCRELHRGGRRQAEAMGSAFMASKSLIQCSSSMHGCTDVFLRWFARYAPRRVSVERDRPEQELADIVSVNT